MNELFVPTRDRIAVDLVDRGEKISQGGIILRDDDFKESGIRPRWAIVLAIGPDVLDVKVGDKVLIGHGDWTRRIRIPDGNGGSRDAWFTEESRIIGIE